MEMSLGSVNPLYEEIYKETQAVLANIGDLPERIT